MDDIIRLKKEIYLSKQKNYNTFKKIKNLKIDTIKYFENIKEYKKISLLILQKYKEILSYKIE
tara:strand:- start:748 stop:936 length:189 start_codon:yes stop_codon:yes gene_type:complete